MIGRTCDQRLKIFDGLFVIAVGVLRIAQPKQDRHAIAAAGVAFAEFAECIGGCREITLPKNSQGIIVGFGLGGLGQKLHAIDGHFAGLEFAQTLAHALRSFLLTLEVLRELFFFAP